MIDTQRVKVQAMSPDKSPARSDPVSIDDKAAPVLVTDQMGRLYYDTKQVALTRLDRSYVAIAAAALRKSRDLALIYPSQPTYLQLPVLLAVGYQTRESPPTLFISNRSGAGIREQYFNVGIGEPYPDAPVKSLADSTAPLVKTGDGKTLSYVTNHKPREWDGGYEGVSIVHSTLGKKLAGDFPSPDELPLSAIVLDLTTKLFSDFSVIRQYQARARDRDIPMLCIFDSPCHSHLEHFERQNLDREESEQTLFWGYSPSILQKAGSGILDTQAPDTTFDPEEVTVTDRDENSPFETSIPVLRNLIHGIERDVTELTYEDLQPVATDAYGKIGKVASYVQQQRESFPRSVSETMRDLYFTHSYLSTLPTSVEFHDDIMAFDSGWGAGSTIDQMIDNLRDNYQTLENDVTGAGNMLEEACEALFRMQKKLVARNPKADEIVSELRAAVDSGESLVILTPTNRSTSLLRSFVTEQVGIRGKELDSADIQFHSLYNTHTIPAGDRLLFPGVPMKSHRPAVMSGTTPRQTYLTYEWETDRLYHRTDELNQWVQDRCGTEAIVHTARQLDVDYSGLEAYLDLPESGHPSTGRQPASGEQTTTDGETDKSDQESMPKTRKRGVGGHAITSVGTSDSAVEASAEIDPESFAPDSDALRNASEYFDDASEQESVNEGRESVELSDDGLAGAVRIDVSGGSYLYEQPDRLLWVYDEQQTGKKRRQRRAANALEPGDLILITERESRRDVFEHIVDKIRSEVPEFKKYGKMLDYWRTNLERTVSEHDLTASDIETALGQYADEKNISDANRGYHSVQDWLNKETIGPNDYKVIEALGEIYDVEIYREMAMEIEASLQEIRNLHRQVGRNLNQLLFTADSAGDNDTWLFEEFGIRVSDVQDAVEYRTVESVSKKAHEVSHRDLGRLFDG
jgi:hypothetical protein